MNKLPKHVQNYFDAFGYDESSFVACEMCAARKWQLRTAQYNGGTEIHHVEPRSRFGSKRKDEQDSVTNLVALCRAHHDLAHGPNSREIKQELKDIISNRVYANERVPR